MTKKKTENMTFDSSNERLTAEILDNCGLNWGQIKRNSLVFNTTIVETKSWSPDKWVATAKGRVYIEDKGRLYATGRAKYNKFVKNNDVAGVIFIFANGSKKLDSRSQTTYMKWAERRGFQAWDLKCVIRNRQVVPTNIPTKEDMMELIRGAMISMEAWKATGKSPNEKKL